ATHTARMLAGWGVARGDRIAMLLHNSAQVALLLHAALRLGATLVPLNVRLSPDELAWQINDSRARLLVVDSRTAALADRARQKQPALVVVNFDDSNMMSAGIARL